MQTSLPERMGIASEPPEIHEMYGTQPGKTCFAHHCLLARRMVERGLDIDHKQLTFRYQGRRCRLTHVFGNVVEELLAGGGPHRAAAISPRR